MSHVDFLLSTDEKPQRKGLKEVKIVKIRIRVIKDKWARYGKIFGKLLNFVRFDVIIVNYRALLTFYKTTPYC